MGQRLQHNQWRHVAESAISRRLRSGFIERSHRTFVCTFCTTTMVRLTPQQRADLRETLRDLANLVAAALILGQFVGEQPFSVWLFLAGLVTWIVFVSFALAVSGGE